MWGRAGLDDEKARGAKSIPDPKTWSLVLLVLFAVLGSILLVALILLALRDLIPAPFSSYGLARTAVLYLGVLVGSAGVALALRRQIMQERRLRLDNEEHKLRLRVQVDHVEEIERAEKQRVVEHLQAQRLEAEKDRRERFVDAARQLGSNEPAIRVAGAYAMSSLAAEWDVPAQRQSCVDVLCGYVRLASADFRRTGEFPSGEHEVVETVLRLIAAGLSSNSDSRWVGVSIDLRGSLIVYADWSSLSVDGLFDLSGARVPASATFVGSQFIGGVAFNGTRFESPTDFSHCRIAKDASFRDSEWIDSIRFVSVSFEGIVNFAESHFEEKAVFSSSRFRRGLVFEDCRFELGASFSGLRVTGEARFGRSQFVRRVTFWDSEFSAGVGFAEAQFGEGLWFRRSRCGGTLGMGRANVRGTLRLDESSVDGDLKLVEMATDADISLDKLKVRGRFVVRDSTFTGTVRPSIDNFIADKEGVAQLGSEPPQDNVLAGSI